MASIEEIRQRKREYGRRYYAANVEAERARSRKYNADHPEARRIYEQKRYTRAETIARLRRAHIKSNYNHPSITPEIIKQLEIEQHDLCAICGNPPSGNQKHLCIDHCHITGALRALLCTGCNQGVGFMEHFMVPRWLAYLNKYNSPKGE
jgi:Recombination endonuclease VII